MPISRKRREAEYRQRHHAANTLLAIKSPLEFGSMRIPKEHTGDGTGFEIINMKLINDKGAVLHQYLFGQHS